MFNLLLLLFFTPTLNILKKSYLFHDYYNFSNPIYYHNNKSLFKYLAISNYSSNSSRFIDTHLNEFNISLIANKYGAYNQHLKPRDDLPEKSRKKKLNPRQFIRNLKKNKTIERDDKPIIFFVSPQQLMIYRAYNKTMNDSKNKRDNITHHDKPHGNNNRSLPTDWNLPHYYF